MSGDVGTGDGAPGRASTVPASLRTPPPTNRGVQITRQRISSYKAPIEASKDGECYLPEFGVDWLTAKTDLEADLVADFLEAALDGGFETAESGSRFYAARKTGPFGASISWAPRFGHKHTSVNLPGSACAALGTQKLIVLSLTLNLIPSRVDLRFDHLPFSPHDCFDAFGRGDVNTHVARTGRSLTYYMSYEEEPLPDCAAELDTTAYFGAPSSDTRMRVYDKRRTPEGYRVNRIELQLRRKRAAMFWQLVVNPGFDNAETVAADTLPEVAIQVMCSHVDFVDRESDANITRADRLSWWDEFVQNRSRMRLSIPKPEATVEGLIAWAEKMAPAFWAYTMLQVKAAAPAQFKTYRDSSGRSRLDPAIWGAFRAALANFAAVGHDKAKGRHWALVNTYRPDLELPAYN